MRLPKYKIIDVPTGGTLEESFSFTQTKLKVNEFRCNGQNVFIEMVLPDDLSHEDRMAVRKITNGVRLFFLSVSTIIAVPLWYYFMYR